MEEKEIEELVRKEIERINDESGWVKHVKEYKNLSFEEAMELAQKEKAEGWMIQHVWTTGYCLYELALQKTERIK